MTGERVRVTIDGQVYEYESGIKLADIAKEHQHRYENDIVLVLIDNKLRELRKSVRTDCEIRLLTTADEAGMQAYRRSATLLMMKSVYDVADEGSIEKVEIQYSLSKGYYFTLKGSVAITEDFLAKVTDRMNELAAQDITIAKRTINTDEAIKLFKQHRMVDKEKLFKYRRVSKVNIYSINNFEDYHYGYMVPSTGYIKYFKLYPYDTGFAMQLPIKEAPKVVPEFLPQRKIFTVLKESSMWGEMLGIDTVGALNNAIAEGRMNELMLVQEALQEKKIAEIAEMIARQPDKKIIMIAGPSSSSKTTFSHRLSIQLMAQGLKPHPIAVDDYFVNRDDSPRDEFGNYNYEVLECLDVELFNKDMAALIRGETVELPSYNFVRGQREYKGNYMKLESDDILVIEGIHCLNERLSYALPRENKFRIYISALTQLNIDEHNRIPTTDGRLIRRMVRDARTRGASARDTIAMWPSVRRGEEENIFPYQEDADVMFNSALIYELAVLKQYAEPLLFGIEKDEPEYIEAKRLLKFFDYFLGVSSENVPQNSMLREFIGGSCFKV